MLTISPHLSSTSEHCPAGGGQHLPREEMHFTWDLAGISGRSRETVWGWIPRVFVTVGQNAEWRRNKYADSRLWNVSLKALVRTVGNGGKAMRALGCLEKVMARTE